MAVAPFARVTQLVERAVSETRAETQTRLGAKLTDELASLDRAPILDAMHGDLAAIQSAWAEGTLGDLGALEIAAQSGIAAPSAQLVTAAA